jgi:segregation and condensation protein B
VEDLRGVHSEGVIETLLTHGLVRISGRKKAMGAPLLYRTTNRFLDVFGLEAIADLPSLEELGELGSAPEDAGDSGPGPNGLASDGVEPDGLATKIGGEDDEA